MERTLKEKGFKSTGYGCWYRDDDCKTLWRRGAMWVLRWPISQFKFVMRLLTEKEMLSMI